ncbi:hypothetical protein KBTX_02676 [wastewater metagenome]|uniref:Uncharacterized protein n=2 Tax=unclassified sequences TaxID=12908 RepID=A0A5B8RFQ6_9ZZZZ|nr:hypothetical protein [Arhodomonas sp. KWT]QEA06344.1 hypothetical protein KBTEX_02676 [uncultured organism]
MVDEYIEDAAVLASVLQTGHEFVSTLTNTATRLLQALADRGWLSDGPP